MDSWIIYEHVKDGADDYREMVLVYGIKKEVVRLWRDGTLEIGTYNSPFDKEFSTNLKQT